MASVVFFVQIISSGLFAFMNLATFSLAFSNSSVVLVANLWTDRPAQPVYSV